MASSTIERIGGERALERIADRLFVEMFPDHEFAPLFKGIDSNEIVDDLRALLRVLFADSPPEEASELRGLCPVFTDAPLGPALRLRVARLFVDCLVEAHVPPNTTLQALDRLYSILHGSEPAPTSGETAGRWGRPQLHAV